MQTTEPSGHFVALVLLGVALAAIGTASGTNFRGFTEWHARLSVRTVAPLQRVPPWRWLPPGTEAARVRYQVVLSRLIGTALALGGVVAIINGVLNLVA